MRRQLMLNWLTNFGNAWKNFMIGTGLDSNSGPPHDYRVLESNVFQVLKVDYACTPEEVQQHFQKFMVVDLNTLMFTMERGQDSSEVRFGASEVKVKVLGCFKTALGNTKRSQDIY